MTEPTTPVPEAVQWGEPDSGEYVKMSVLMGHLLIVYVIDHIPHVQTQFTQPGKKSDALQVDIIDLNQPGDDGQAGKVYRRQNWMSGPVIANLKGAVGADPRLGVLSQGVATKGQPPWHFTSMTGNPEAVTAANAWAAAHPGFERSKPQPHPVYVPEAPPQQYQQPQGYPPASQQQSQWGPPQQQPAHWGPPQAQPQWSQPAQPQGPINTQGWGQPQWAPQPQQQPAGQWQQGQPQWAPQPQQQPAGQWQQGQPPAPAQQQLPPPPPQQQQPTMLQQMQAAQQQGQQWQGPSQEQAQAGY